MTALSGTIKNLTFYNEESGFFVASIEADGQPLFTAIGNAAGLTPGVKLELEGEWVRNKHGAQFKATMARSALPDNREGLARFLASGSLPGVGPVLAGRLVEHFGMTVLDVLRDSPARLQEVPKLGKKKAEAIAEAWASRADMHKDADALIFLRQYGLSANRAKKVNDWYKKKGRKTIEALRENPYDLTRLWGIGFARADTFALSLGIPPTAPYRMRAAITHVVKTVQDNGSCGVPSADAVRIGIELTSQPEELLRDAIEAELSAGILKLETASGQDVLFHKTIYEAEQCIANRLADIMRAAPSKKVTSPESGLSAVETALGRPWDAIQAQAVLSALKNKVFVITGGPGTGKTTVTQALIRSLTDSGLVVKHCAPTGKAADRAREATGFASQTIHRLLEVNQSGDFSRNQENPLECDALIVDEPSMVDAWLFLSILNALPDTSRIYLTGDADQLPSVGPGRVLQDLLDSKVIPYTKLTKVFRQGAGSRIIAAAAQFNSGAAPELGWEEGADFGFIDPAPNKRLNTPEEKAAYRAAILAEMMKVLEEIWMQGFDPLRDVQILAPMKMGVLGIENLNQQARELLNPDGPEFTVGKKTFRIGDKVIQLANCYTKMVFNGEIGFIKGMDEATENVMIAMPGRDVEYTQSDLRDMDLGYAITIHKSQGSEFPAVLMALDWSHFMMLKRNLGFTGMTRAKSLLVLFGSVSAVRKAASTPELDERYSRLAHLLPVAVGAHLAELVKNANLERQAA